MPEILANYPVTDPAAPAHNYRLPCQVWLTPSVGALRQVVAHELRFEARVLEVPQSLVMAAFGPAIVIATPADLSPSCQDAFARLLQRARPGRLILLGGERDRHALLTAINQWRVFRLVPTELGVRGVVDAVRKSHEATETEVALELGVAELQRQNHQLEQALRRLSSTRGQLLHAERLATLGRLTQGLGSQIADHRRALAALDVAAKASELEPSIATSFAQTIDSNQALGVLLEDLTYFAQDGERPLNKQALALDAVLTDVLRLAALDPTARKRRLVSDLRAGVTLPLDRYSLYQVVLNLLRNAMQATKDGGLIQLKSSISRDRACVEVIDDGVGMTEEVRDRLFEPFFTTKGEEGIGLGLRVSRLAVERHGGKLECTSEPRRGATFRVLLPLG